MNWTENNLFEKQVFQHTAALYFQVPLRELKINAYTIFHQELKIESSIDKFYKKVENNLLDIYKFDENFFKKIYNKCSSDKLHGFASKLYTTYHSNYPNLFRELKSSKKFWFYTFLISSLISYKIIKKNYKKTVIFLNNFKISFIVSHNKIVLIGPIVNEELNQEWYKKIKRIFRIENQIYEMRTLYENMTYQNKNYGLKNIKSFFKIVDKQLELMEKVLSKDELIKISSVALDKKHNPQNIISKIKKRRKERDISYADYFDNILYEKGSFSGFENKTELKKVINRLTKNINADYAIYYEYNKNSKFKKLTKFAYGDLSKAQEEALDKTINELNSKIFKNSLTYYVIDKFNKTKEVSALIRNSENDIKMQPFKGTDTIIKSLLSFPIIFDNSIIGVLHFVSKRESAFNSDDKNFIFRLLKPITYQHVSSKFQKELNAVLEELNKLKDDKKDFEKLFFDIFTKVSTIICSVFSADASSLWFNKREILKIQSELDNINMIASCNMFLKSKDYYADSDSYITRNNGNNLLSVIDIKSETSSFKGDRNYLKYKDELLKDGFKSLYMHILKKDNKTIGAIIIANKELKEYNKLSDRMFKIISSQINSMLSTIEHIVYKNTRISEKNLHDSSKFLNMIDSSARMLSNRIDKLYIIDKTQKHNINYNMQDIKDYSKITREFITALMEGNEFKKDSDALLKFQIEKLKEDERKNRVRDIIQAHLKSYEEKFYAKKIRYENKLEYNSTVLINKYVLSSVFLNLIDNAYKYSKDGTTIEILEKHTPNGYYIEIVNIGFIIDNFDKINIFKKGRRAYRALYSSKDEHKENQSENKGLGLYYSSVLTKEWGGSIKLQSSNPIGGIYAKNIFVVYIPYFKFSTKEHK